MAAIHRPPSAALHAGTSAPCDPNISRTIDRILVQLEADPKPLKRVMLRLLKRWIERHIPAFPATSARAGGQ